MVLWKLARAGSAAILAAAIVLWAASVVAKPVGKVWLIKEKAFEKLDFGSSWEDLFIDDQIILNQWVRTPPDAALHVRFADGTDLRLGANTELLIDKYVYDPSGKTVGEATFSLLTGMTRIITGNNVKKVRVRTPTTTIGIRGSDIVMAQLPIYGSIVQVNSGQVRLIACSVFGSGQSFANACDGAPNVLVGAGQSAGVTPGTTQIALGISLPYEDPGLRDDGGLLDIEPEAGPRRASLTPSPYRGNEPEWSNLNLRTPDFPTQTTQGSQTVSPTDPIFDQRDKRRGKLYPIDGSRAQGFDSLNLLLRP